MRAFHRTRHVFFLGVVLLASSAPGVADELRLLFNADESGPFPAGAGGQVAYTVSVEIVDVESDGFESQGIAGISWDIFTDTGAAPPNSQPALTGETGILGPATVNLVRYEETPGTTERFVGGYGFQSQFGPFSGNSNEDDLLDVLAFMPLVWLADGEPNVPGLQPLAMGGVGIGERPAGGDWLLAEGLFNYPSEPGTYTIDLDLTDGLFILPGLDLAVNQVSYTGLFDTSQLVGDSFSFVVVPEPGAGVFMALALLFRRKRRAH